MSHSELAIAGLYDHEHEVVHEKQRRIPDWGGDEVFASTPRRRRFEHREDFQDRAAHALRDTHEQPLPRRRQVDTWLDEAPARPAALTEADVPFEDEVAALVADEAPLADELPAADPYMEEPQVAANGRRVVTITGHPGATARVHRPADAARRPPRTWDERLTHRPEQVAMWAFALGILLIIIAVASS